MALVCLYILELGKSRFLESTLYTNVSMQLSLLSALWLLLLHNTNRVIKLSNLSEKLIY